MKKNIFLILFIFLCSLTINAQKNEKIWNAILKNNREEALKMTSKINSRKANLESLIVKQIVNIENGNFENEPSFNKYFASQKEYEYFLFALWKQKMFFENYHEQGFNKNIVDKVNFYYNQKITNTTVKGGLVYLEGITERYINNFIQYKEHIKQLKAISEWQFCGVFENLNDSGMDEVYPPETTAYSKENFNANSNGKINWFETGYKSFGYQFFQNNSEYGKGVNYAQTFFSSPKVQTLFLKLGSDKPTKLWVNDILVFEKNKQQISELDAYTIKIKVPKGNNRILVKTTNDSNTYFILRVFDEKGDLISPKSLNFTSTYNKYNKNQLLAHKEIENPFETYFKNLDTKKYSPFFKDYLLIQTYLRNGKTDKAKEIVAANLKKYPKSSFLRTLSIIIANKDKDYTLGKEISENRKKDDPNYYMSLLEEIQDVKKLFKMSPEEMNNRLDFIKKSIKMPIIQQTVELIKHLRTQDKSTFKKDLDSIFAISKKMKSAKLMVTYAKFYTSMFQNKDKTLSILNDIYKNYFSYQAYSALIKEYKSRNEKDKVDFLFNDMITKLPDDLTPLYDYAKFLMNNQKYSKAIVVIDKGLKIFPYSFSFMRLKGDALLQLKNDKEALKWYEKSFSHDSGNSSLREKIMDLKNEKDIIEDFSFDEPYKFIKAERGKKLDKEYDFNILLDQKTIELYNEGGTKSKIVSIYEILTDNGVERLKEYDLGLYYDYTINKAEIIKPNGNIIPAEKSGSKFVFNSLSVGDVILIDYEKFNNNSGRFYKDMTESYQFGTFYPNYKTIFRLITPKKKPIYFQTENGKINLKKKNKGNYTIYEWTQENPQIMPPTESYMPEINEVATELFLSTIKEWSTISNWYSDLVRTQIEYDKVVNDTFASLFPNGFSQLSEEQRARIIYNYMINNLTYSYVSFKQSGFVPQKPSKTIKSKLGDCKDFSTLFLALAKKAGIKTNLVLISTSDLGKKNILMPTTSFNHCIVRTILDGKEQYLELTDKYLSFKTLPTSLENALALNIPFKSSKDNKNTLIVLKNLNQNKTIIQNDIVLTINKENQILKNTVTTTGKLNSSYRDLLSEKNIDQLKIDVTKYFQKREDLDLTLKGLKIIQNEKEKDTIIFETSFTVNNKIKKLGKFKLLKLPQFFRPYTDVIVNLENRNYPINYNKYERVDQYILNYTILLEDDSKFIELPDNNEFTYKKHHYKTTYSKINDHKLKVSIIADIDRNDISTTDYPDFRKFVKQILEVNDELIGFK